MAAKNDGLDTYREKAESQERSDKVQNNQGN
jgi:hypothetical protein